MSAGSLIDKTFVTNFVTAGDRWSDSHGSAADSEDLAAGILYYALAYAYRAKTCVCLGSGGGFVPRLMRQAQRDLAISDSITYLVDADELVPQDRKFWGAPTWTDPQSLFRRNYPEIEVIIEFTEKAYEEYFVPRDIAIDYLHIDADHNYDGVKKDWDLYTNLVAENGIITLHDTVNYREPCGVPQLVEEIAAAGDYRLVNFPLRYGTAIVQKVPRGRQERIY